jgi:hypothetical protein
MEKKRALAMSASKVAHSYTRQINLYCQLNDGETLEKTKWPKFLISESTGWSQVISRQAWPF